jgi:hypothetical protein
MVVEGFEVTGFSLTCVVCVALCHVTGAVKDSLIGEHTLCSFLLEMLNHYNPRAYCDAFGIPHRITDVNTLLYYVAARLDSLPLPKLVSATVKAASDSNTTQTVQVIPERDLVLTATQRARAAAHVIALYRAGRLGRYTFDDIPALPAPTSSSTSTAAAAAENNAAPSSSERKSAPASAPAAPAMSADESEPKVLRPGQIERRARQAQAKVPNSFANKLKRTTFQTATSYNK